MQGNSSTKKKDRKKSGRAGEQEKYEISSGTSKNGEVKRGKKKDIDFSEEDLIPHDPSVNLDKKEEKFYSKRETEFGNLSQKIRSLKEGAKDPKKRVERAERVLKHRLVHGFYHKQLLHCNYCKDRNDCPAATKDQRKGRKGEFKHVPCMYEKTIFNDLVNRIHNNLDEGSQVSFDAYSAGQLALEFILMARKYRFISERGVTYQAPIKDKEGDVHITEVENILMKNIGEDRASLRQWINSLQLSPKARKPQEKKIDIALSMEKIIRSEEEKDPGDENDGR